MEKAEKLGILDQYDGQLEAEVVAYREKQPWRELQVREVSGPADEAAEALADLPETPPTGPGNLPSETDAAADPAGTDQPATAPPTIDPPARSIDF